MLVGSIHRVCVCVISDTATESLRRCHLASTRLALIVNAAIYACMYIHVYIKYAISSHQTVTSAGGVYKGEKLVGREEGLRPI